MKRGSLGQPRGTSPPTPVPGLLLTCLPASCQRVVQSRRLAGCQPLVGWLITVALDPLLMQEAECDSGEDGDERRENYAGSGEAKVVAVAVPVKRRWSPELGHQG
jgi:hypothetical protein